MALTIINNKFQHLRLELLMILQKSKLWVKREQKKLTSVAVLEQYRKVYMEMRNFNIDWFPAEQ